MGVSSIGAGISGASQNNAASAGSSKAELESRIKQLEREHSDYIKLRKLDDSAKLEQKITENETKLRNLQSRLDKLESKKEEEKNDGKCETCENRKYQDGSDDPGVSFKMASHISPEGAEAAVRGHENEHVMRNQAKAAREGKEIVYQSVRIKKAICPECGRSYVAGGVTETVTRTRPKNRYDTGKPEAAEQKGKLLDLGA